MLRFDLPRIPAHVARFDAFVTFCIAGLALLLQQPWLMLPLAVVGLLRGFFGHMKDPLHRLGRAAFEARGWGGKLEDAGAKMFAAKILCIAATVSLGLFLAGSTVWQVPAGALVLFSLLEWAAGFCAGCWVYSTWYRFLPPTA
jgi:Domain of unknown function (DUF4395)